MRQRDPCDLLLYDGPTTAHNALFAKRRRKAYQKIFLLVAGEGDVLDPLPPTSYTRIPTRHSKRALWKEEILGFVEKEQGEVYYGSRKDVRVATFKFSQLALPSQTRLALKPTWCDSSCGQVCQRHSFLQSA